MDFSEIVGHADVKKHLQNAVRMHKTSHAYLFHGEEGSGKKLAADIFSMALQCKTEGGGPCGQCRSCRQAASRNHPDIIRVQHEKETVRVEDIRRQLNQEIWIKPYVGNYKIYIIEEAERMNEQAQNALLKTIEEPPPYAVILLLASNTEAFLPTVASRCVLLAFRPLPKELIQKSLMEKHKIPDYLAKICAVFSGGIYGKALKYACSDEFMGMKEAVARMLMRLREMSHQEILEAVQYFGGQKKQIEDCIELMLMWFRDVLFFKACAEEEPLYFREEAEFVKRQAALYSYEALSETMDGFDRLKKRLQANVNFEFSFELLLLEINGCRK